MLFAMKNTLNPRCVKRTIDTGGHSRVYSPAMTCILRRVPGARRVGRRPVSFFERSTASSGTGRAIGGPRPVTVTVEGEVRRPGSYTLPHDATLSTLIIAAGGYTDNADLASATLKREYAKPVATPLSHPRLLKGSPADLPLADGDTLRIPPRMPGAPARTRARPADLEPFTRPNNFGVTGLLETPTARMMPENRYRLGATQVYPYRYFFGTVGLYDRLEVNGRVTEIIGVTAFANLPGSSYGNDKDKAVDAKFLILKERRFLPAVAIVISDPHGTGLYSSQAIVASKQFFPFDVSFGFGNGRLGKQPLTSQGEGFNVELFSNPGKWASDALPFGGIQFAATPWLSLLAEYSPIRYERQTTDPAQPKYFQTAVPSPYQFRRPRQAAQVAGDRRELAAGKRVRRFRLRRLRHRPPAGPDPRRTVPGTRRGAPRPAPGPDRLRPLRTKASATSPFRTTGSPCGSTWRTTGTSSRPMPSRCSSPRSPRSFRRRWSTSGCS